MKLKANIFLALAFLLTTSAFSNVYLVTNTNGNGWFPACGDPGSLLEAICNATTNPGRDTIRFNLPGGTVVNSTKDPLAITAAQSDLFIDGLSVQDGNPITLGFSITVAGTDVDFYGLNFTTSIHSLALTGNNNSVDSCFFAVTGAGQNAVWINGGTGSTVKKCVFTAANLHAVSIENGGGHLVDSCVATGINDVAIIARGTGGNTISNCIVSSGSHNGIGLISGNNIVENCQTFDNGRAGIVCDNASGTSSGNIIRNNLVYGNNKTFWTNGSGKPLIEQAGISSDGPNTEIYNNWIYDNAANGILVNSAWASGAIIRKNVVGRDQLGTELGNGWNGIFVWSGNNPTVDSNIVVNNGKGASHSSWTMPDRVSGIRIESITSGTVSENYSGTDENKAVAGNAFDGITLYTNSTGVDILNNVSCNNGFDASAYGEGGGIALRTGSGNNVTIAGNYVGVHKDMSDGGNYDYGISIEGGGNVTIGGDNSADGNIVGYSKNTPLIGSARGCGIWLVLAGATNNSVLNNQIINNAGPGVEIERNASNNIVGDQNKGNTITGNQFGILVHTNAALSNTLRYNSFSCNTQGGISLQDGGNTEYGNTPLPKGIVIRSGEARANFISGYAPSANAVVDVYGMDTNCPLACTDSVNQGMTMVATVSAAAVASSNGLFAWEYDFVSGGNLVDKNTAIVLATEFGVAGQVNTSEFSICHLECDTPKNATINAADFDLCPGETASLEANSVGMSTSGYTYNWYLGSIDPLNLVHTATDDSTYSTAQDGNYFVVIASISDADACADTSALAAVNAHQNPTINLTPSSTSLCSNGSVSLDADATGSNLDYLWSPSGETTAIINVTTGGVHEVTVTNSVTNCESTADVTLTEFKVPDPITINASDLSLCPGETADLEANSNGLSNSDGYTYTWYLNTVGVGNEVNTAVNDSAYSTDVAGNYLVVISNNASSGLCSATSAAASVVVHDNPSINLTPSNTSLCEGETITLDADASGANLTYTWTPNGETTAVISITSGGTYGVTVTNVTSGCDNNDDILIDENELPIVSASAPFFCQGDSTMVSAGVSEMTYLWSPSGETAQSFYVNETGTHYLLVTNPSTGCEARDTVTAERSPVAKPIVVLPADTSMCPAEGDEIELVATIVSNATGILSWSDGIVAETSIIATDSLDYIATFEDEYGCIGADTVKVNNLCIPPDPELPNVLTEQSPWTPIGDITPEQVLNGNLTVYDRWGLLMYESTELIPLWEGENLKGVACSAGVYYWVWTFTDNTYEERRYNGFVQLLK